MPFFLIKGRYHVVNYSPDGDTVRFQPDDPAKLALLSGPPADVNARGHVSLRLESIDTLETHYSGLKQPPPFADGATDFLLDMLGIRNVVWAAERRSIRSADDNIEGHILARATDRYRRVIAFAFPGTGNEADGAEIFLDGNRLKDSVNFHLAEEGLAFATFYWGLFADLREVVRDAAKAARDAGKGVYADDRSTLGFEPHTLSAVTDDIVMMPKLFRRLSTYLKETGTSTGFKAALEASAEPVLDLRTQNITHFDTFVTQNNGLVRMTQPSEDFVFDPMPTRIGTDFNALLAAANRAGNLSGTVGLARSAEVEPSQFARRVASLKAKWSKQ